MRRPISSSSDHGVPCESRPPAGTGRVRETSGAGCPTRPCGKTRAGLTYRERDVVMPGVNGLSNKEISRAPGISHRTVERHRAHGMAKLGVKSVSDLMRRLLVPVR